MPEEYLTGGKKIIAVRGTYPKASTNFILRCAGSNLRWWQRGWYNRMRPGLIRVRKADACAQTQPPTRIRQVHTHAQMCGENHLGQCGIWTRECWRRIAVLPVLLHPSDGFVLVELPLEFVLLQGEHRHDSCVSGHSAPTRRFSAVMFRFRLFPREPLLASLVPLSNPLGCARAAADSSSSTARAYALILKEEYSGS